MGAELVVAAVFISEFFFEGNLQREPHIALYHTTVYESVAACEDAKARLAADIAAMLERSIAGNESGMLTGEGGIFRFESRADCYALRS